MKIREHLDKLGLKAVDKVTGHKGVIESVSFDLYGCIQVVLRAPVGKDGKIPDAGWYDIQRLRVTGKKPVMKRPDFDYDPAVPGLKGPADKPIPA